MFYHNTNFKAGSVFRGRVTSERRSFHDCFAEDINKLGEQGVQFSDAVNTVIEAALKRGLLSEYLNIS